MGAESGLGGFGFLGYRFCYPAPTRNYWIPDHIGHPTFWVLDISSLGFSTFSNLILNVMLAKIVCINSNSNTFMPAKLILDNF